MDELIINTAGFKLSQADFIIRLLVALGMGALIGIERQHTAMKENKESFAGIRTFMFVLLLGFMSAMVFYVLSPWVSFGILAIVAILTGISYWITASKGDIGATTEFTVVIAFLLGTFCFLGFIAISLVITVVVLVLLSAKLKMHAVIGKISGEELYDFIRFVVLALLIFPFLPDSTFGPNNIINPREIGWVIVLTSGLGFIGYILMKFMDSRKGILLSGIIGGLISSTATTWVFAKKSKENEAHSLSCAIAILAASSIMIIRVLVWIFIFNRSLFNQIYLAFIPVFLAAVAVTLYLYFRDKGKEKIESAIRQGKPLDLQGAFVFGIIYVVILLVVNYANETLGEKGMMFSSAIAGLSDIDAITISVSKLAGINLDMLVASKAILIATISNTLVKMGIGMWGGSHALRRYLYLGYGFIFVAALIAFIFLI
ncbi:MAG TPA: MgtC/SapB family protein [Ferruginibacter sp.]|nr:MgtC/SapB family protein [Ferruginibacter sp.]